MRAAALGLLLLPPLWACQSSEDYRSGTIHRADSDGVSFAAIDGWHIERDRDAWVQVGQKEDSRTTIAVRSISRDGWSEDRIPEMVLPATETFLRSLPGARVQGPEAFEHPEYRADVFEVSFQPSSEGGKRYDRRHVVLFGDGERVFHVLHTGPEGTLENSRKEFERVAKSLREEG